MLKVQFSVTLCRTSHTNLATLLAQSRDCSY